MKTKYLAFAATAFMLASCSNNEDFIPQGGILKDSPITVIAGVEGMLTRAGYEGTSVLPEMFYLSITQDTEDASSPYNYINVLMTKGADNTYIPTGNLLWKDGNRDVEINAYTTDATSFTVPTDQSTDANVLAGDLLGAVKATENSDITILGDNISIKFRHLLSKLDVTFSWGTEFITENKSITSVEYVGFGTDVSIDRAACALTNGTTIDDITAYLTTAEEGETYLSEAIFAPYVGDAPSVVITAIIDDVERVFSIGVNTPADGFASGNRYTMNVTVGGTSVEDASVTANIANGWEDGDANGDENGITGNMNTK